MARTHFTPRRARRAHVRTAAARRSQRTRPLIAIISARYKWRARAIFLRGFSIVDHNGRVCAHSPLHTRARARVNVARNRAGVFLFLFRASAHVLICASPSTFNSIGRSARSMFCTCSPACKLRGASAARALIVAALTRPRPRARARRLRTLNDMKTIGCDGQIAAAAADNNHLRTRARSPQITLISQ